jgi:hypothetical protein
MERVDEYFSRHLWLQVAASWAAATGLVLVLFPGHSVIGVVIRVVVCSAAGVWAALRHRHREQKAAGGTDGLLRLERLLRRGEAPSDPQQRQAMRELVDRRLHRTRHRRSALTVMAVLLAGVTALTAAASGLWHTLAFGAYSVAFFLYLYFGGRLGVRQLHQMRRMLAAEDTATGTVPAAGEPAHHHHRFAA